MVTVLEDCAVKELAVIAVLPLVVRLLPVSVMALLDVIVPPEAVIVVLVAVMELALTVELLFIVILLLLTVRALEDVRLLEVPSIVILLLLLIVTELAFIVLPSCMVKLVPSELNALLVFRVELFESTTLLLVKEAALRDMEPLLPETSIKEEVKEAVELLTWSVVLAIWIESLVKVAELNVTLAFICIRVWLIVEVLFELDSAKLTATLSLEKLTLLKEVALLISSVSLLKVVDPLLKSKLEVMFTVPPLNVQPLQVPLEFSRSVQPAGILMVQLLQVPPETRDAQVWLLLVTV